MGKLMVVKGDAVQGQDLHDVSGSTSSAPPVAYTGTGKFAYKGAITDGLSNFVNIAGQPVALKTSKSSLNSGESNPGGGHDPQNAENGVYTPSTANPLTLSFLPPVTGVGTPSASSGSGLLTIGGVKVLLDGDQFDTCDGLDPSNTANSSITASGQSFVKCSA